MEICKFSKHIPIFNVDGILNKNSQISEIVDIVLYY